MLFGNILIIELEGRRFRRIQNLQLQAQNLYLAGEALGCAVCAIGGYDQRLADKLLGLDGVDEFVVYYALVGKKR